MKALNYVLCVAGLLTSLALSIYAAQPWGDNYAYQDIYGYVSLFVWDLWIALPFALLLLLCRYYRNSAAHMKLLFVACLLISIAATFVYIDAVVFSTSSTSVLIFIFLPLYQLCFAAVIWLICVLMRRSLNKTLQPKPKVGATDR